MIHKCIGIVYVHLWPAFFYFSFYEAADPVSGTSEKM